MKRDRLASAVERRGISNEVALSCLSRPLLPVQSVKDHTGGETALRGVGPRGRGLRTIGTEGARGVPTQAPVLITPQEPRVLITGGANPSISFWMLGQLSLCSLKPLVHFPLDPLL